MEHMNTQTSMQSRINGRFMFFGQSAPENQLQVVQVSPAQSQELLAQLLAKPLVEEYARMPSIATQARAGEILSSVLHSQQLDVIRGRGFFHLVGIQPGSELNFKSYAGSRRLLRAMDKASLVSSLLLEGVANVMGASFVRLPGVQDPDDARHYISTVAAMAGQEERVNSGGLKDFGFHGDNDGMVHKLVDQLMLVGQIADGMTPTLYSELSWALEYMQAHLPSAVYEEDMSALARPLFHLEPPTLASTKQQNWHRTVYVPGEPEFFFHPLISVDETVSKIHRAVATRAIAHLREALEQTAVGVFLQPMQVLHMPNRQGKHAVWEKTVYPDRLNLRQMQRAWLNVHFRDKGHHVLEAIVN